MSPPSAPTLPPALEAEVRALAIELITAHRAGLHGAEAALGPSMDLVELLASNPGHQLAIYGALVGRLAGYAAHAFTGWDQAQPGRGTAVLTVAAAHAARLRS